MTYDFTQSPTSAEGLVSPNLVDVCSGSAFITFMTLLNALIRSNEKISGLDERVKSVKRPRNQYDFVVIGGGAAGSAAAGRLSEIRNWNVLLLEAGPDEPVGAAIPGFATKFLGTEITWNYTTTNESHACLSTNGSCAWPQGRNLGGNTVHNGMIYLRGYPKDYNHWAELGNEGWTWDEVERYFKKAEDNGEIDRVGREHHGTGGPLPVERFPYLPPFSHSILAAATEAGFGVSEDLNGDQKSGFSIIQAMNKNGVRRSSAAAYLRPVRHRKNLHVSLNSVATKLIVNNGTVVGVEYYKNGRKKTVHVTREVVLSAGVVESPHILLLSGIGPKEHLESVGVKVVKDVPGVGENLHDHPCAVIPFTMNKTDTYDNDWLTSMQYLAFQTGPLSSIGTMQVVGMVASNATTPENPDIEIYTYSYLPNCGTGEIGALQSEGRRNVILLPSYLEPKSRGRITLASNDPFEYPVIWTNYLGEPEDLEGVVTAIKMSLAMVNTEAMRPYNLTLSNAPLEACADQVFLTDEYWACVAKQVNYALYHQAGTCKMGPSSDPMAVVDPRLRFHGIRGLRVADTSIMPKVPSCNTAAPAIMIGERVADFIKEDYGVC